VRLAFLGSPEVAVPPLRALVAAGHDVALVVTNPDRRRGRGGATSPTPVAEAARVAGLPVSNRPEDVLDADVELGVVVAYGRLLGPELFDAVPLVNLHFSLLPRWRGAAPVERAVLAGDVETGVCLMGIEPTLDTGPVYRVARLPISDDVTAGELLGQLSRIGADLLVEALDEGLGEPVAQSTEGVTYAAKLTTADRHLDWERPASELSRVVRIGRAWTTLEGRRLVVHSARPAGPGPTLANGSMRVVDGRVLVSCGGGDRLELLQVQPEGRSPQDAAAFVRGHRPGDDARLGG
jgi:methionyl-tRNA formyltransferase